MQQVIKTFVLASMLAAGAADAEDTYLSLTISNPQEVEVHVDGVQKKNCCSRVAVIPLALGLHRIIVKSDGYQTLEWSIKSPGDGSALAREVRLTKSGDSTVAVASPPVVDTSECITEGTMAGKKAWREFKWGAGGDLCAKLTEVNTLVTETYKDNPITPCDNAFNDAVGEYVDEQVEQLNDRCAKERIAEAKRLAAEAQRKRDEEATVTGTLPSTTPPHIVPAEPITSTIRQSSHLQVGTINIAISNSGKVLTKIDTSTGQWIGQQDFDTFYGMLWVPEHDALFVSGILSGGNSPVILRIRSLGGGGQNMFAVESDGGPISGYNYRIGSQSMIAKDMSYKNDTLFIDNGAGVIYKIRGVGGGGYNMFALDGVFQ